MYLENRDVAALSDALKRPEVAWWMLDFSGAGLKKRMDKKSSGMMQNAPLKFAPENGLAYFEDLGWRLPLWFRLLSRLPQPDPGNHGDKPWSAVARLTH